jgi:hypothetical protein
MARGTHPIHEPKGQLVSKYDDYAQAERDAGREPLEMPQWRAQRMQSGRQTEAEATPDPTPSSPVSSTVPDLPATMTFFCENRFRVEVMQAGHMDRVGNTAVLVPQRNIEFNECHWTADMSLEDHREKVEWLMNCPAYRKGEIVLVPEVRPNRGIQVRTGPRTTSTPRLERIERPAGMLSARLDG